MESVKRVHDPAWCSIQCWTWSGGGAAKSLLILFSASLSHLTFHFNAEPWREYRHWWLIHSLWVIALIPPSTRPNNRWSEAQGRQLSSDCVNREKLICMSRNKSFLVCFSNYSSTRRQKELIKNVDPLQAPNHIRSRLKFQQSSGSARWGWNALEHAVIVDK